MNVRCAMESELDLLAQIWHDSWRDAHERILPAELTRARTRESFRLRLAAAIADVRVVDVAGEPAGLSIVKGDELYQLFVSAPARGTGAAALLVADAEARIADAGARVAWLACAIGNDRAARFYERCGWRRAGATVIRVEVPDGAFPLEVWRYEKELGRSGQ